MRCGLGADPVLSAGFDNEKQMQNLGYKTMPVVCGVEEELAAYYSYFVSHFERHLTGADEDVGLGAGKSASQCLTKQRTKSSLFGGEKRCNRTSCTVVPRCCGLFATGKRAETLRRLMHGHAGMYL